MTNPSQSSSSSSSTNPSSNSSATIGGTDAAKSNADQVIEDVPDFTGQITNIVLSSVTIRASNKNETTKYELPKKIFLAKNLQVTIVQDKTKKFMRYRTGIL